MDYRKNKKNLKTTEKEVRILCKQDSRKDRPDIFAEYDLFLAKLPEDKVNGFVDELDKIFVHSKEKFLGKHIFVNWIEFPYVKASYSCYKPGQWTTIAGLEMEAVGNFYFAGEHCSELFQGFMNGAAETGRRVAEELIAVNKK